MKVAMLDRVLPFGTMDGQHYTRESPPQAESPLHSFLESIGFSRVDAHAICGAIESGKTVHGVMGDK